MNFIRLKKCKISLNNGLYALSLIAVLALLWPSPPVKAAEDNNVTISCSDVNDVSSCSITGGSGAAQGLVDIAENLFDVIEDPDSSSGCIREGDSARCDFNDPESDFALDLICDINEGASFEPSTANCQVENLPPEFLTISCTDNADGTGNCSLTSQADSIENVLDDIGDLSPNQRKTGTDIISGCLLQAGTQSFQNDCEPILSATADGDGDAIANTLAVVTPLNADQPLDAGRHLSRMPMEQIHHRMQRTRRGVGNIDVSGLRYYDGRQWLAVGEHTASNHDTQIDAAADQSRIHSDGLGFFLDGMILDSEQDAGDSEDTVESGTTMLTAGADFRVNTNWVAGLAFSTSVTTTDYTQGAGTLDTNAYLLMAYATYTREQLYAEAAFGLGGDNHEQTRNLRCGTECTHSFDQAASSEFSGEQTVYSLRLGFNWNRGPLGVSPYASLSGQMLSVDAYREIMSDPDAAGAGFALDMSEQDQDIQTAILGAQINYVLSQNWGVLLPYADLQMVSELENAASSSTGSFVGNVATDAEFELVNNDIDDNYFKLGLGTSFQLRNGNAGYVALTSFLENDDIDATQINVGWRWSIE